MNATPGYSFRYFRIRSGSWVCVLHAHSRSPDGKPQRIGVAAGQGRRKETARAACIENNEAKVQEEVKNAEV